MLNRMNRVLISIIVGVFVVSGPAIAQEDDYEACVSACTDTEDSCFEACDDQEDSAACQADCTESAEECIEKCDG